jgi:hypothetical protein
MEKGVDSIRGIPASGDLVTKSIVVFAVPHPLHGSGFVDISTITIT